MHRGKLITAIAAAAAVSLAGAMPASAAPIQFAPVVTYPTPSWAGPGPGAQTTAAADYDQDGDTDVVITDWFGSGPLLMRNNGTGAFGAATTIGFGGGVFSIATGDFNGDGRPDLAGRTGYSVILWRNAGNGTFQQSGELYALSNAQPAISVADLNGDGRLDIVVPSAPGIQVFLGTGSGSFTTGPLSPLAALMSDVAVANLNGDSIPDLLVVDATPFLQRIIAMRGVGGGSFQQTGSGPTGYGPEAVNAVDLNNDGIDDAASSDSFSFANNIASFSITVLISNGAGQFGSPATYPTGAGPVSGAVGDFNRDGNADVAISAVVGSTVTVYAGNGTGALAPGNALATGAAPQTPAAADLDRDGDLDLAIPGVAQLSVLKNIS